MSSPEDREHRGDRADELLRRALLDEDHAAAVALRVDRAAAVARP